MQHGLFDADNDIRKQLMSQAAVVRASAKYITGFDPSKDITALKPRIEQAFQDIWVAKENLRCAREALSAFTISELK